MFNSKEHSLIFFVMAGRLPAAGTAAFNNEMHAKARAFVLNQLTFKLQVSTALSPVRLWRRNLNVTGDAGRFIFRRTRRESLFILDDSS